MSRFDDIRKKTSRKRKPPIRLTPSDVGKHCAELWLLDAETALILTDYRYRFIKTFGRPQ